MSCSDCQKEMLVFDLLDNSEQVKLKAHLSTCSGCEAEWIKIEKLNSSLAQAHHYSAQPAHPIQLTNRILTGVIESERSKNRFKSSKTRDLADFLRFGFAGISMCLIIFFVIEFTAPVINVPQTPSVGIKKITLRGDWLKTKLPQRTQSNFIEPCIAKNAIIDLACLKANQHRLIRNIKNKH